MFEVYQKKLKKIDIKVIIVNEEVNHGNISAPKYNFTFQPAQMRH